MMNNSSDFTVLPTSIGNDQTGYVRVDVMDDLQPDMDRDYEIAAAMHLSLEIVRGPKAGQCLILDERRMLLGRSKEADLQIPSPGVSRRQLEFNRREDGMFMINLSSVTKVLVNGRIVAKTRLYDGDEMVFAGSVMRFKSNRPQDCWSNDADIEECDTLIMDSGSKGVVSQVMAQTAKLQPISAGVTIHQEARSFVWGKKGLMALFAFIAFGLLHQEVYVPWQLENSLQEAEFIVESGDYDAAVAVINGVIAAKPDQESMIMARELLARATLLKGQSLRKNGELKRALALVNDYMGSSAVASDLTALNDLRDGLNFQLGERHKNRKELQKALKHYVAIPPESALYFKAQRAIVAMGFDQVAAGSDAKAVTIVTGLLQKAEPLFAAKQYLTPKDGNAYALYKRVLDLDPGNTIALARIEAMKTFYERVANLYTEQKRYKRAYTFYRRYLQLAPGDSAIKKRAVAVKRYGAWQDRLAAIKKSGVVGPAETVTAAMVDKVKPAPRFSAVMAAVDEAKKSVAPDAVAKTAEPVNDAVAPQKKAVLLAANSESAGRKRVERILKDSDIKPGWITEYLYSDMKEQDAPW